MMGVKIFLVQPRYPSSPMKGGYLPVGLGYIAEQLELNDFSYEFMDMTFDTEAALFEDIAKYKPEFVGFSVMSLDIYCHYKLIKNVKTRFPDVKTITGGPHVSFVKSKTLEECDYIDYGVVHEGEETLIYLLQGRPVESIKGLIYRDSGGEVVYNGDRPFIMDLDGISFPKYRNFNIFRYDKNLSIASSRGCPFSCIFCGAFLSMGRRWRAKSVKKMLEEITYWYEKGYRDFHFVDSNFFFSQNRIIELCEALGKKDLTISMTSDGMRGKDASYEMLLKMKTFGLKSVAIGIESANDDILKSIKKGENLNDLRNCMEMLKSLDIDVVAFFVIGLPGESVRHVLNSFLFALKYPNISYAYFFNPNPLFGTELYSIAKKKNYLRMNEKEVYNNIGGMADDILIETPELSIRKRKILFKVAKIVSRLVSKRHMIYKLLKKYRRKPSLIIKDIKNIETNLRVRNKIDPRFFSIPTQVTREELIRLYLLSSSCSVKPVIVEVGSYLGASTCFLAAGARSKGGNVYAVDSWQNMAMTEGTRDTFEEFSRNTEPVRDSIVALRGLSSDMAKGFDRKIDLLFIDGDHSYEACLLDWKSWSCFLSPGAIVAFHDTGWAEGVQRVVSEEVASRAKKQGRLPNLYWAWI